MDLTELDNRIEATVMAEFNRERDEAARAASAGALPIKLTPDVHTGNFDPSPVDAARAASS